MAAALYELRPADVKVKHSFELKNERSIHHSVRRLAQKHSDLVREELNKMLKAEDLTSSASIFFLNIAVL